MSIVSLFCEIDDFFLEYEKWKSTHCLPETIPIETRGRPRRLHPSEVMTILIAFQQSNYRTLDLREKLHSQNVKLTKTKRATELFRCPFCERKILYMKTLA